MFLLCLCRSRQILGYVCRPIKGSQLAPYVQVRLVCKVLSVNTFLRIMVFFFTMCDLSPLNFPALKMLRTGVRCYICNLCCTYGSGCLLILCRTALNICGIRLRSNNRDNICLYCLQTTFIRYIFFFFCS